MHSGGQRERLAAWLDAGLRKPGKKATALADSLGISESAVSNMRKGKRGIKAEELPVIARYLEEEPPADTGRNTKVVSGSAYPAPIPKLRMLKVIGVAEAGAFRQIDMLAQVQEQFLEIAGPSAYPSVTHYALIIRGDSMDRAGIVDGDHVSVADYGELGFPLKNGTIVHVERSTDGGYIEWTLKEVHAFPDRYELRPRSSNPAHQPLVIPRTGDQEDNEIRIRGIVVGVHRILGF